MRKNGIPLDYLCLVLKKVRGQITSEGSILGLLALEKKYPNIRPMSFKQAAEAY
jgi:hypothetical protein